MYLAYQVYRENWISEIIRDTFINSDVEGGEPEMQNSQGNSERIKKKIQQASWSVFRSYWQPTEMSYESF